jgi:hypothetical protein
LHGPIARSPGILCWDQPVVVEFGIVDVLADVVTERGVALVDHVVQNCVFGRVAAFAHRPDVAELVVVLCPARDLLAVLDLVVRMLEVETVAAMTPVSSATSSPFPPGVGHLAALPFGALSAWAEPRPRPTKPRPW